MGQPIIGGDHDHDERTENPPVIHHPSINPRACRLPSTSARPLGDDLAIFFPQAQSVSHPPCYNGSSIAVSICDQAVLERFLSACGS